MVFDPKKEYCEEKQMVRVGMVISAKCTKWKCVIFLVSKK